MRLANIVFLSFLLLNKISAQKINSLPCQTLNASKDGIILHKTNYFNKIGILLQDTCSSFNRFDQSFYLGSSNTGGALYYKAIVVDSTLAISLEMQLKNSTLKRYDRMKNSVVNASERLKNFIRLYGGFVTEAGDTCIVVQYLTYHEYVKDKYYSRQLNLIAAKNRSLRFVVFEKNKSEWLIRSSFPDDLL